MYAGGYLCRFAFQPPWSVFNSRQTLFHCCISLPSISLNLHLAKYCVSQTRHPFKVATLKAFQLEPFPSLLPLIRGGFHVMFPSQRSLTVFVQAWTLSRKNFSCIRTAQVSAFRRCHAISALSSSQSSSTPYAAMWSFLSSFFFLSLV